MRTVILSPAAYNLAETTRMIEIGKAICDDFNVLFVHYGGDYSHLILEAGFDSRTLRPIITPEKAAYLYKIDQGQALGYFFSVEEVEQQVQNEIGLFKTIGPVAAVTGFNFSLSVSCRAIGVPLVWVTQSTWFMDRYYRSGLGTHADLVDLPLLRLLPESFLVWLTRTAFGVMNFLVRPYNVVGKQYDVSPFPNLERLWDGDHNLLAEPEGFSGELGLPAKYHCIGPLIGRLDEPIPHEILIMPRDKPIVYFAMGSSGQPRVIAKIIEGFNGKNYRVITPSKKLLDGVPCKIPDNVVLTGWLPAHKVNPLADVSVIHGGIGTTMTACLAGKPVVGVAMQPEQEINIDCLVRKGFAMRIRKSRLAPETLCDAIDTMLADKEAQGKAAEFAATVKKWDDPAIVRAFFRGTFGEVQSESNGNGGKEVPTS